MKLFRKLSAFLGVFVILLSAAAVSASADAIFVPEDDFIEDHYDECERVNRTFYLNGSEGYVAVYSSPEKDKPDEYFLNGGMVAVSHSWDSGKWALVTYGKDGDTVSVGYNQSAWVLMDDLYPVYDNVEFLREHELTQRQVTLTVDEGTLVLYSYPCSADKWSFSVGEFEYTADSVYVDEQGRTWICIPYHYGLRDCWACVEEYDNENIPAVTYEPELIPAASPDSVPETGGADGRNIALVTAASAAILVAAISVLRRKKDASENTEE